MIEIWSDERVCSWSCGILWDFVGFYVQGPPLTVSGALPKPQITFYGCIVYVQNTYICVFAT